MLLLSHTCGMPRSVLLRGMPTQHATVPGNGVVTVGNAGTGGMTWTAEADTLLDFWVTALPKGAAATEAAPIYSQYADATGHAPALRDDAMIFWQSRNRYSDFDLNLDRFPADFSAFDTPYRLPSAARWALLSAHA